MEKIRAFVAIELSGDVKRLLTRLQDKLKSGCAAPVRWTDPASSHLTLRFLGDIDSGLISKITAGISSSANGIHPFQLGVSSMGVFPDQRRVRVVWVGLNGALEILCNLQKRIESSLAPLGFTPEARSFTPHLTLGRVRDNATPEERQNLGGLVVKTAVGNESGFEVKSVFLIKSRLTTQGPVYTRIGSVELK